MNSQAKMLEMQMQIRENATELKDYLSELEMWQSDIKKQDETFANMKPKQETLFAPVRGSAKTKKKINSKIEEKPKRIKSYDFKSWDKLDVDKLIDDIDAKEEEKEAEKQEEIQKDMIQLSQDKKNMGNDHFKAGRYDKSIECYTKGMQFDPSNPVIPANRAMAYFKLKRYVECEVDCTLSLSLDPTYVKAYLRRGASRNALGKVDSAIRDYNDVLKLEPDNKQARHELASIHGKMNRLSRDVAEDNEESMKSRSNKPCIVTPIHKPPNQRSKKPLRRIEVVEVGGVDPKELTEEDEPRTQKGTMFSVDPDHVTKHDLPEVNAKEAHPVKEKFVPSVPSPPSTCFQFQVDVRKLGSHHSVLFDYLSQLTTDNIPSLLKDQLDTDMLLNILNCFLECYYKNSEFVIKFLHKLSQSKRFDMAVMFMTNSDRRGIQSLHGKLLEENPDRSEKLNNLFASYGL